MARCRCGTNGFIGATGGGATTLEELDEQITDAEMIPQVSQILYTIDGCLLYMLDESVVYASE